MRFASSLAACVLLAVALSALERDRLSSSSDVTSNSGGILFAQAGSLEELLAEGIDMLNDKGKPRHSASGQIRDTTKSNPPADQCTVFKCPRKDHVALPKPDWVPTSNGCGTYGFKIDSKWHESCCDVHDKCYGSCNMRRDKCDNDFKKCMNQQCAKHSKREKEECDNQASMFYTATRTFGCQPYQDSQKEACTCSLKERAKKALKAGADKLAEAADAAKDAVKNAVGADDAKDAPAAKGNKEKSKKKKQESKPQKQEEKDL